MSWLRGTEGWDELGGRAPPIRTRTGNGDELWEGNNIPIFAHPPYIPIKQTTPSPARHPPAFPRHLPYLITSQNDRPSARPGRQWPPASLSPLLPSLSHARPSPSARDSRSKAPHPDPALTSPYRGPFHPELAEDRPRCLPIRHAPRSFRSRRSSVPPLSPPPRRSLPLRLLAPAHPRLLCVPPRPARRPALRGAQLARPGMRHRAAAEGRVSPAQASQIKSCYPWLR